LPTLPYSALYVTLSTDQWGCISTPGSIRNLLLLPNLVILVFYFYLVKKHNFVRESILFTYSGRSTSGGGRELHVVSVAVTDEHFTDYAILEAMGGSVRVADSYVGPVRVVHKGAVGLAKVLVRCQTFGGYAS